MTLFKHLLAPSIIAFSLLTMGLANAAMKPNLEAEIKAKLLQIGLPVSEIEDAPIAGFKQVLTNNGVFYVSEDAKLLLHGRVFDIDSMKNLTQTAFGESRLKKIAPFNDSMIVYPAKDEKHTVTVFTDTTCFYCQKLHSKIKEYNDLGITVRYLAFPRGGLVSQSFDNLEHVWCAADPNSAMTKVKEDMENKRQPQLNSVANCDAPIAEHYALGKSFGINGTPAIILDNGVLIPGFQEPEKLLNTLNN